MKALNDSPESILKNNGKVGRLDIAINLSVEDIEEIKSVFLFSKGNMQRQAPGIVETTPAISTGARTRTRTGGAYSSSMEMAVDCHITPINVLQKLSYAGSIDAQKFFVRALCIAVGGKADSVAAPAGVSGRVLRNCSYDGETAAGFE